MIKYLQLPTCKLAEFSPAGDTSFTVSGFLLNDGITPVATVDIGDICYATLEPKTAREELISFTIASVTTAGVATITATRGLLQKSPYTVGGATFDHQNGSDFVISNNPGLFNQLTAKDNPEVITAQWSFPAPSANNSPATKSYADSLVILGGAEATNLTRGISLLSADPATTIGVITVTIATPAVVSFVAHGLIAGDSIKFTTTGSLPTGLVAATRYFVQTTGLTANTFRVSATLGGADINTTGSQSGVHTLIKITPVAVGYNDTTKLPTINEKAAMVGSGAAPSSLNKFVTQDMYQGFFGDGSDGTVTISTPTTLTRDMYYDNLTVNDVITTGGYRIFVKNTISGTGTIKTPDGNVGGNGTDSGTETGGAEATAFTGGVGVNTLGGAGGTGDGSTSGGVNAATAGVVGTNGYIGSVPGNPGAGTSGANISKQKFGIEKWSTFALLEGTSLGVVRRSIPGAGGANGAGSADAGVRGRGSGAGGASGGIVLIFAKVWAGTFTIMAIGGNGGRGGNASSGVYYGGNGGAGAAGGSSVVIYLTKTWTGSYVLTAGIGGIGGTNFGGPTGGTGSVAGTNGTVGTSYEIPIGNLI